jgi:parallel beta-helix repeat protein
MLKMPFMKLVNLAANAGVFLYLLLPCLLHAAPHWYYIDAVSGNDNRNGLAPALAWRTLSRLNAAQNILQPGDQVFFHRAQVFTGSLRLNADGVSYGAYGDGEMPVISGFTTVTNWVALGDGVYEAACNSGPSLNMVIVNDVVTGMGRYPNEDAPNAGYLTIDAHNGVSSISCNAMGSSFVFTGGEAVIRKRHWVLDRCPITSQTNHTLYYKSPTSFDAIDGFGFFIQNHPATLDKMGEWWYDAANKKLRMYFGAQLPGNFIVKAATTDILITVQYGSNNAATRNITINSLHLSGADSIGINIYYSNRLSLVNCTIDYTGSNAVNSDNADQLLVKGCTINHSNNKGINTNYSNNVIVDNTTVKNTGLIAGMGLSNNQNHTAVGLTCDKGCEVINSRIDSSGYCGIAITGDSFLVQNNFVSNFCLTVDDGGGIYNWGADGKTGRRILNNIVMGGKGASAGTELAEASNAHGINLDDRSVNVEISGNSVAACNGAGIAIHNSHYLTIIHNTIYDTQSQLTMNHDNLEPDVPIRNIVVKNNILIAKTQQQYVLNNSSAADDFSDFGLLDSNVYCRPLDSLGIVLNYYAGNVIGYNLGLWQSIYRHDQYSKDGFSLTPYKINKTGSNLVVNGNFDENTNGSSCSSSPTTCSINWSSGHLQAGELKVNGAGTNILYANIDLGQVTAGKDYLLRFSTLGTGKKLSMAATIIHTGGNFENRSGGAYFPLLPVRRDNELLFHSNNTEPVFLVLKVYGLDAPFYADDIELKEVNASKTNPDDSLQFIYNETAQAKEFSLAGNYKDVKNNYYLSRISLKPYSSGVLLKVPASFIIPNQPPVADAGKDTTVQSTPSPAFLDGRKSFDPEGAAIGFQWVQLSGPENLVINNAGAATASVRILQQGEYVFELTVTDDKGMTGKDTVNIFADNLGPGAVGVLYMKIFPNPASFLLNFELSDDSRGQVAMVLLDVTGKTIRKLQFSKDQVTIRERIDISYLKSGLYYLWILYPNGQKIFRPFVKH